MNLTPSREAPMLMACGEGEILQIGASGRGADSGRGFCGTERRVEKVPWPDLGQEAGQMNVGRKGGVGRRERATTN